MYKRFYRFVFVFSLLAFSPINVSRWLLANDGQASVDPTRPGVRGDCCPTIDHSGQGGLGSPATATQGIVQHNNLRSNVDDPRGLVWLSPNGVTPAFQLDTNNNLLWAFTGAPFQGHNGDTNYYLIGIDISQGGDSPDIPLDFQFHRMNCYQSTDLENWTKQSAVPLSSAQAGIGDLLRRNRFIASPHAVWNELTQKYVLWAFSGTADDPVPAHCCANDPGCTDPAPAGYCGYCNPVQPGGCLQLLIRATSSTPCGPYTEVFPEHSVAYAGDFTVFVDSDGKGYLIASDSIGVLGKGGGLILYQLTDDYQNIVGSGDGRSVPWGSVSPLVNPGMYEIIIPDAGKTETSYEAPAMFKAQGNYYLAVSYATGWDSNDNMVFYLPASDNYNLWNSPNFPFSLMGPLVRRADGLSHDLKTCMSQSRNVFQLSDNLVLSFFDRITNGTLALQVDLLTPARRMNHSRLIVEPIVINGTDPCFGEGTVPCPEMYCYRSYQIDMNADGGPALYGVARPMIGLPCVTSADCYGGSCVSRYCQ
jgi:hypothetical protein